MSGCVTCYVIQQINHGSIVFFQEQEDISAFCGFGEGIITRGVGLSFFFTEGLNFSVFFGQGNIFTIGVGRFDQVISGSISSLARTAYLLFSNDLDVGTAG